MDPYCIQFDTLWLKWLKCYFICNLYIKWYLWCDNHIKCKQPHHLYLMSWPTIDDAGVLSKRITCSNVATIRLSGKIFLKNTQTALKGSINIKHVRRK